MDDLISRRELLKKMMEIKKVAAMEKGSGELDEATENKIVAIMDMFAELVMKQSAAKPKEERTDMMFIKKMGLAAIIGAAVCLGIWYNDMPSGRAGVLVGVLAFISLTIYT